MRFGVEKVRVNQTTEEQAGAERVGKMVLGRRRRGGRKHESVGGEAGKETGNLFIAASVSHPRFGLLSQLSRSRKVTDGRQTRVVSVHRAGNQRRVHSLDCLNPKT